MPRIAEESIQRVADASNIVEIIGSYFPLKPAGANFRALCPFHKEKSPSFNVNPSRQSFHCFGCGAGGGVFRFVMDYEHVDFPTAVRRLAQKAGIVLSEENDPEEQSRRDQRSRLLELHKEAAEWYHSKLLRSQDAEHARAYLRKRGLSKEIAVAWQLGFAPEGWDVFRTWGLSKGFTRMELIQGGLLTSKEGDQTGGYDRFRDRLMFPIRNDYGEVVAFSGRILSESEREAKYVNSPETPIFSKGRVLFGLDKSKRSLVDSGTAIVLEGQIDLISAFEHGITNVVAPQGTAFTNEQARLLRRFVERVILCFDSDTAGQNAVEKSLPALLSAGIDVRVASLPGGSDPDSLIREKGVEVFQEQINGATDFFEHTIRKEMNRAEENFGAREKANVARKLGAYLSLLPEAVLRETTASHVASRLGLSVEALMEAGRKNPIIPHDEQSDDPVSGSVNLSESTQLICRLAIHSKEVREWLSSLASPTPSELDPELGILDEILHSPNSAKDSAFASVFSKEKNHLPSITPSDPLAAVQDAINRLKLQNLKKRELSIKLELNKSGLSLERILTINKEILDLRAKIDEISTPAT
ncbi:MAG: DNA primase [bacterium]